MLLRILLPAILVCATPAAAEPGGDKAAAPGVELKVTEKVLGPLQTWFDGELIISPDGRHAAWTVAAGAKGKRIVVDGEEGKRTYDEIDRIVFSPDGRRLAFRATRGKNRLAVIDGVEGKEYASVDDLHFSDDGSRVGYVTETPFDPPWGPRYAAVIDGVEGKTYRSRPVEDLTFSHDGKHVAYVVNPSQTRPISCVVMDGVEGDAYDDIQPSSLRVSPDGRHVAFVDHIYSSEMKGRQYHVVLDGRQGKFYDRIDGAWLQMSPDGGHFAYAAEQDDSYVAVVDGKESKAYHNVDPFAFRFSPDGRRVAYEAYKDRDTRVVVVDDKEGPEGEAPQHFELGFGADGKRFAYITHHEDRVCCVTDEGEGKRYRGIYAFSVSPDGKHVAYQAQCDDLDSVVVLDEKEGKVYNEVYAFCFTARGKHLVQVANVRKDSDRVDVNYVYVTDGVEAPLPPSIIPESGRLVHDPDGRHTAFLASKSAGAGSGYVIVVDGVAIADIPSPLSIIRSEFRLAFAGPNRLGMLGERDGKVIYTEIEIREK